MPIPTKITDLSVTAASNSPQGSETVGPSMDDYMRGIQQVVRKESFHNITAKTGNYTVTTDDVDKVIECNALAGGFTISLPAATTVTNGFQVTVKKTDSAETFVTVDANSSETIDGEFSHILWRKGQTVVYVCDGVGWVKVQGEEDYGRRNLLLNGKARFWQEKTLYTGITVSQEVCDKFHLRVLSSGTWKFERSTDVPTFAQAAKILKFSMRATVTTADATVGATDYVAIEQRVEGWIAKQSFKHPYCLMFWAKSNKIGDYYASFRSSTDDASYVSKFCIDAIDTWERKKVRVVAPVNIGTWDHESGVGLKVALSLTAGLALRSGTQDAWVSGNLPSSTDPVNLGGTINNYMAVTDLVLLVGSDPNVPYEDWDLIEESDLIRRYKEKSYAIDTVVASVEAATEHNSFLAKVIPNGSTYFFPFNFYVPKRAAPTITIYDKDGNTGQVSVLGVNRAASVQAANISYRGFIGVRNDSGVQWEAGEDLRFHYYVTADI